VWRCKWHVLSSDDDDDGQHDHASTLRSFLVLACMHHGCIVVELAISSSREQPSSYAVTIVSQYHHNHLSCSSPTKESVAQLLYGIAVIHNRSAIADQCSHAIDDGYDTSRLKSTSNRHRDDKDDDSSRSGLILATCYFNEVVIEVACGQYQAQSRRIIIVIIAMPVIC